MATYAAWLADTDTERLTADDGPLAGTLHFINNEGALIFHDDAYDRLAALPDGSDYRIERSEYGLTMWIAGYALNVMRLYG